MDAFDAITADRVYQKKSNPFTALDKLRKEGSTYIDPELKEIFIDRIPNYFVQEKVRLSNGKVGEIIFINPRSLKDPIIKLKDDYLDLSRLDDVEVVEIIRP